MRNDESLKGETMKIVVLESAQIPLAGKLFADVFQKEPWNFAWINEEKATAYFRYMEASPESLGFFLMEEDEVIGCCMGQINPYFEFVTYDIKEIYIVTSHQGEGKGSFFLEAIEDFLRNIRVHVVNLLTSGQIDAFQFYLKNGYEVSENTTFMQKLILPISI